MLLVCKGDVICTTEISQECDIGLVIGPGILCKPFILLGITIGAQTDPLCHEYVLIGGNSAK